MKAGTVVLVPIMLLQVFCKRTTSRQDHQAGHSWVEDVMSTMMTCLFCRHPSAVDSFTELHVTTHDETGTH